MFTAKFWSKEKSCRIRKEKMFCNITLKYYNWYVISFDAVFMEMSFDHRRYERQTYLYHWIAVSETGSQLERSLYIDKKKH